MKWAKPELGSVRDITKFALFPITIGRETRWLERVKIRQHYLANWYRNARWFSAMFIDE